MDAIELTDPRIPESFRNKVVVDERTGCWGWCGPTIGGGSTPSYRHRPALNWIWDHLATRRDVRPNEPLIRVPTTCGRKTCLNPYHRLTGTDTTFVHKPHRCPVCKEWCQDSLEKNGAPESDGHF